MSKSLTIVLENRQILGEICGVNDENLKSIEETLGAGVFSHGNELLLDSGDKEKQFLFKKMIDQLKEHQRIGRIPDPELVRTIHDSIVNGSGSDSKLLKEAYIHIPNSTKIFPRSRHQASYIQGMNNNEIIFGIGPAGTGKTYLAVAHALCEILNHSRKKLVLTRPVVEAGESLGFLPGDLSQKISPYLRPLYDAMQDLVPFDMISRMEDNGIIEISPLAYMRGRSLKNSYIILDEAQNTTKEQMKMFLTRIGEGSKAVITGDITQIDLPPKSRSGLIHVTKILRSIKEIHFSYFDAGDVVRNHLVKKIVHAYETEDK